MRYFILFGPPGAGKGTQSKLIAKRYNFRHLSTGELLREEISKGSEIGKVAADLIEHGQFVPDELVIDIVKKVVCNPDSNKEGYIFDGFPRTINQAQALDDILTKCYHQVDAVISLETSDNISIERIRHRANIEGRKDDADFETIRSRIDTYHKITEPLIKYYVDKGKYLAINGNQNIEDSYTEISKIIDKILNG